MASMTIRNIDDRLQSRLRVRAANNGRSIEDEARDILASALAVTDAPVMNIAESIRKKVEAIGGVESGELVLPPRSMTRGPIDFGQ